MRYWSKVEYLSQNNDEIPVAEIRCDSEDGDTDEQTGAAMAGGLEVVDSSPTLLERLEKTASDIVEWEARIKAVRDERERANGGRPSIPTRRELKTQLFRELRWRALKSSVRFVSREGIMTMKVPAHLLPPNIKGTSHTEQATTKMFDDLKDVLVFAMDLYKSSPSVRRAAAGTFLPPSDVSIGQTIPFTPFMIGSSMCNGLVSSLESFHKLDIADKTPRYEDDGYIEHTRVQNDLIDVRRACERAWVRCDDQQLTDMLRSVREGTESVVAKWRNVNDDVLHSIETEGTITLQDIQEELRSLQQTYAALKTPYYLEQFPEPSEDEDAKQDIIAQFPERFIMPTQEHISEKRTVAFQSEIWERLTELPSGPPPGELVSTVFPTMVRSEIVPASCDWMKAMGRIMTRSVSRTERETFWSELDRLRQIRTSGPRGSKRRRTPSWEEESFNPKRVCADDDDDEYNGYYEANKPSSPSEAVMEDSDVGDSDVEMQGVGEEMQVQEQMQVPDEELFSFIDFDD